MQNRFQNIACRAGQAGPKIYLPHHSVNKGELHCEESDQSITYQAPQVRVLFCLPNCNFFKPNSLATCNRAGGNVARCLMTWLPYLTVSLHYDTFPYVVTLFPYIVTSFPYVVTLFLYIVTSFPYVVTLFLYIVTSFHYVVTLFPYVATLFPYIATLFPYLMTSFPRVM